MLATDHRKTLREKFVPLRRRTLVALAALYRAIADEEALHPQATGVGLTPLESFGSPLVDSEALARIDGHLRGNPSVDLLGLQLSPRDPFDTTSRPWWATYGLEGKKR